MDVQGPTTFQHEVLRIPSKFNLFLGGGRGGGKSYAQLFLILRHADAYGDRSRQVYIRQSFPAVRDFEALTQQVFKQLYGPTCNYNSSRHVWVLPGNASLELSQLMRIRDYDKFQGRSFGQLIVDEAGQFAVPDLIDTMRSNLRGPEGVPTRTIIAANPGGPGHYWLHRRFASKPPWQPFFCEETQAWWVHVPSTYKLNATIDQEKYEQGLIGATVHDKELRKAWLYGDWNIARGAFFSDVITGVHQNLFTSVEWREWVRDVPQIADTAYLAHDWGSSAPSVTGLMWESPGCRDPKGRYWPRGSKLLLSEVATYEPPQYDKGTGETPAELARHIHAMCQQWGVRPFGCADDACFAQQRGKNAETIADEFAAAGVYFEPAKKGDRVTGWTHLRGLMKAAEQLVDPETPPEKPLFAADPQCGYFWGTVPTLTRHAKKVEDIADEQPDHAADMVRYGAFWDGPRVIGSGAIHGLH